MAASRLYNNVILNAGKVFEALSSLPSLQRCGASVVKWPHAGEYEREDA